MNQHHVVVKGDRYLQGVERTVPKWGAFATAKVYNTKAGTDSACDAYGGTGIGPVQLTAVQPAEEQIPPKIERILNSKHNEFLIEDGYPVVVSKWNGRVEQTGLHTIREDYLRRVVSLAEERGFAKDQLRFCLQYPAGREDVWLTVVEFKQQFEYRKSNGHSDFWIRKPSGRSI